MCPCQNVCPWPSAPAPDWQARAEAAEAALAAFAAAVKELDRVSRDISAGYSDAAPCAIIVDLATGVEAWATIGAFRALSAAFSAYAPVQEPLPINLEKN